MKKVTYEISFTARQLKVIDKQINETFDSYIEKNHKSPLTTAERDHLMGQTKDQLAVYIQEISGNSEKWGMSHKRIPVTVSASKSKAPKDLMSIVNKKDEDRFFYNKGLWFVQDSSNGDGMTYQEFVKAIYSEIYQGASTAAFYSIDSFISCREKFGK